MIQRHPVRRIKGMGRGFHYSQLRWGIGQSELCTVAGAVSQAFPYCSPKDASASSKEHGSPSPAASYLPVSTCPPSARVRVCPALSALLPLQAGSSLLLDLLVIAPLTAVGWAGVFLFTKGTGRLWQPQAHTPSFFGEPGPFRRGGTAEGFLQGLTKRQDRRLACLAAEQWAFTAALAAPLAPSTVPLSAPAGHSWSPGNYDSVRTIPSHPAGKGRCRKDVGRCLDKEGAVPADKTS